MNRALLVRALGVLVLGLPLGCTGVRRTVRVVHGQPLVQREIPEQAYASYVRAAELEHRGALDRAQAAYRVALASDPGSVEIQTRIAAIACRRGDARGVAWFEAARRQDAHYEPLWRELALCRLSRGEVAAARAAAERAVGLDPERAEASVVMARVLAREGRRDDARRWLIAILARDPAGAAAREARSELAHLAAADAELFPPPEAARRRGHPEVADVDRAILEQDIEQARSLAFLAGVPPAVLALRAAALGRVEIARAQAELVLGANPDSASAWIAALQAADLGRDIGASERAALLLGADPEPPTPLAARLLAELLARQVGADASSAWLTANGELPPPEGALERALAARLRR